MNERKLLRCIFKGKLDEKRPFHSYSQFGSASWSIFHNFPRFSETLVKPVFKNFVDWSNWQIKAGATVSNLIFALAFRILTKSTPSEPLWATVRRLKTYFSFFLISQKFQTLSSGNISGVSWLGRYRHHYSKTQSALQPLSLSSWPNSMQWNPLN